MLSRKLASGIVLNCMVCSFAVASHPVNYSITSPSSSVITGTFGSISGSFSGVATIQKQCGFIPIDLECNYQIEAVIYDPDTPGSERLIMKIDDAQATAGSGPLCDGQFYDNFPWSGDVLHQAIPSTPADPTPIAILINDVRVASSCGTCEGSLTATFSNSGAGMVSLFGELPYSYGGLSGDCYINASGMTSTDGSTIRIWH